MHLPAPAALPRAKGAAEAKEPEVRGALQPQYTQVVLGLNSPLASMLFSVLDHRACVVTRL